MKKDFLSPPFQRLFKNTGLLLSGDTVSAFFGVLTFAVSARCLGAQRLGMLVLIDAYVRIVDKLMNFQSWQGMIKYGSDALEANDKKGFKALVKFGTLVDGFTAILGCLVSIALTRRVGEWQGWSEEMMRLAMIYSLIIVFDVAGVPTGILRIFDRFKLFSIQKSIAASMKLAGVIIAAMAGCGLRGFLWVWMITEIFDYVSLTWLAWRELKKRGYCGIWSEPLTGLTKKFRGLWSFLISTNLTGSVKVGFREFDVLVVGKLLNLTDVSLYKLAKKLCASLDRLTNPLFQSLYPELTKSWARRDQKSFKKMVLHMIYIMGIISAAAWILFVIFGKPIIWIVAGKEFLNAYSVTVWYLLANGIAIATLPLAPMILAMGKANLSFFIQFFPTLIYFPLLFWMIGVFGLDGAGQAFLVFQGLRVLLQWFFIETKLKGLINSQLPLEPETI